MRFGRSTRAAPGAESLAVWIRGFVVKMERLLIVVAMCAAAAGIATIIAAWLSHILDVV